MEKNSAIEADIYENIISMVDRETRKLSLLMRMEIEDLKRLDVLTKIYATLKDDLRNDVKAGIAA